MANYCTTADVKSFNPHRTYNTTSKPTLQQVTSYIAFVTADMNMRMGAVGITVPISTSPASETTRGLKFICAMGSACQAENAAFMGGNKQSSEHADWLCSRYQAMMLRIEENPAIISGDSFSSFASYESENTDEQRTTEPFTRGEDDW